jgi:hypothetical protein
MNDARSDLILYVESDGRHMAAITHGGKLVWNRNLFDNPRLSGMFSATQFEDPVKAAKWRQSYISKIVIDRIGVAPNCAARFIDRDLPTRFRAHYIRVGSGNGMTWLLDAKTGDIQLWPRQ